MSWGSEEVCFKGKLNKKRKRKIVLNSEEVKDFNDEMENPPKDVELTKKQVKFDSKTINLDQTKEKNKEKRAKIVDKVNKDIDASKKSKRQLKREKNEARLATLKNEKDNQFLLEILNYLSKWEHNRDEWKFEKKKNFYIFHNILNEDKIPDQIWNSVLEYVNNSKGNTIKEKAIKDAVQIIESVENDNSEINNKKYERARTLVQFLK